MYADQLETLRVYELEPKLKHPAIFNLFDKLPPGGSFIIENDHDPAPLYYQLKSERSVELGGFEYLQNGPEIWKVEIIKTHIAQDRSGVCSIPPRPDNSGTGEAAVYGSAQPAGKDAGQPDTLDVTKLPPPLKHPTVFEWFNKLAPGQSFILKNDHDPKPLFYQMLGLLGPVFNWQYIEEGPDWWLVTIAKHQVNEPTVGELAAGDARKAAAMKKMGIDFCCGGNKTISQAAREADISEEELEQALTEAVDADQSIRLDFSKWDAGFLADYIYNQHHKYFYENKDLVAQLAEKVMKVHGAAHPELISVHKLVNNLFNELLIHFRKEEEDLFPYIRELTQYEKNGERPLIAASLSAGPLAEMQNEHENAGELLRLLRKLTSSYQLPADACGSFRRLYEGLEELEQDLHQHIHLENNILFVKAMELERKILG